jgi:predicted nuclease of restriction endonuclease-like RecB superfamily
MLTGNLVRVRFSRDRIIPRYIDPDDESWRGAAERLLELFRTQVGRTRGELDEELNEAIGNDTAQLVHRGVAKLLEDRCEFDVISGLPPEQVRDAVFRAAAEHRKNSSVLHLPPSPAHPGTPPSFDRDGVLTQVAAHLNMTASELDHCLFADLKSEQQVIKFKDSTAERLLQRYNVALAQAVLLRSTSLTATIRGEPPARFRQLLRLVKFHRLICEATRIGPDAIQLRLDGPLSLFNATQKYGLQLALFLPAILLCRDFELQADVRWGPQRKPKTFTLTDKDGLVSHQRDTGTYVPPELAMFADLFRKKVDDWEISDETDLFPLGDAFWVPDFRLTHKGSGRSVLLEVFGFWRRSNVEQHLERLRGHLSTPFLLAVSDQLHIEDADLEGLSAMVHRFRQMPLPAEVARLAAGLVTR